MNLNWRFWIPYESRFLGHGEDALEQLEDSGYTQLYENTLEHGFVCHGEFNQHNVLMVREKNGEKAIAVTNFDKWGFDVQMVDLYQFMRKILEKHDWNIPLGKSMVQAYEEIRPLSKREKENLKYASLIRKNIGNWQIIIIRIIRHGFLKKIWKSWSVWQIRKKMAKFCRISVTKKQCSV